MKQYTYGSLFAGVGGFDLGLDAASWTCKFQVEWDKNCQHILNRHWPDVPKWGDVSTVSGTEIPPVDCIIFGSPCQDLSVAGKRAGLEGERSGLFHEAVRIVKEMRDVTNGAFPRWAIWENVAGALSSNAGQDFATVINEMAEAGAVLQEFAVLDAQHFGVPQRRRRVFLVACFDSATAFNCPDPLLPVSESVRGDSAKGKSKGKGVAGEVAASTGAGGGTGEGHVDGNGVLRGTVTSKWHKGAGGPAGDEAYNLVVEPFVRAGRARSNTDAETWVDGEVNPTLNIFDVGDTRTTTAIVEVDPVGTLQARSYKGPNHEAARDGQLIVEQSPLLLDGRRVDDVRVYTEPVQTLQERMGTGGNNVPVVAQEPVAIPIQDGREMVKNQNGFGVAGDGSPAYTLDQTGAQAVAYSIREDATANNFSATEIETARALQALQPSVQSHHAQTFVVQNTFAFDTQFGSNANVFVDQSPTLKASQ